MTENNDQHWKDRIENKIDTLQESMILLARAEERLINMEDDRRQIWKKLNTLTAKLEEIEMLSHDSAKTLSTLRKFFWVVIPIMVAFGLSQYI